MLMGMLGRHRERIYFLEELERPRWKCQVDKIGVRSIACEDVKWFNVTQDGGQQRI
jgi:hypothetical protein